MTEKQNPICFTPVSSPDSSILILGSFPGVKSLNDQQYYAHSRNAFWKILGDLFSFDYRSEYLERVNNLIKQKVGLWDVLQSCQREGSLDSNIYHSTIVTNNFKNFFRDHVKIKAIFFNGSRAEQEFRKRVVPELGDVLDPMKMIRLPSTSPAMAMLTYEEKRAAWKIVRDYL